jgi:Mg-chelatase subunit ChlD
MTVMLFLCAVAVDAGIAFLSRSRMSKAADAAGLAAAKFSGQGTAAMQAAALAVGAANFPGASFTTTVDVDANDVAVITVEGRRSIPTTFGHVAGITSFDVAAGTEVTRFPLDLSLVLDVSSSMVASSSFAPMQDAAKRFLDLFDEARDQLGIVAFATVAEEQYAIQKNFKAGAKAAVDALPSYPDTNLMHGIQLGRAQLQAAPVRGDGTGKRRVILVLFTDGQPTAVTDAYANVRTMDPSCAPASRDLSGAIAAGASPGSPIRAFTESAPAGNTRRRVCFFPSTFTTNLFPSPYSPLPVTLPDGSAVDQANGDSVRVYARARALAEARATRQVNAVVFTIGLGNPSAVDAWRVPDQDLLRRIANENGVESTIETKGQMFFAPDSATLEGIFEQVATRILTRLTR